MRAWQKAAVLRICLYGILKKIRPGTPFLTPFLLEAKNLTTAELYGEVFPCWTYANLLSVVPIFIASDLLYYRPIIVLESLSIFVTWALLIYGEGVRQMQIMQISFGVATSTEVAFSSYLYAVVDASHYRRVTSYISSATMFGRFFGYSLGQVLVSAELATYLTLNQISFYAFALCIIVAFCLPSVGKVSDCDKRNDGSDTKNGVDVKVSPIKSTGDDNIEMTLLKKLDDDLKNISIERLFQSNSEVEANCPIDAIDVVAAEAPPRALLGDAPQPDTLHKLCVEFVRDLIHAYRSPVVLSWSIWWALTSCGVFQVFNYIQTLWALRQEGGQYMANGFVESLNTLIGVLAAFALQYSTVNWRQWAVAVFAASSMVYAALLVAAVAVRQIFVDYSAYLCLTTIYNLLMIVANHEIATELAVSNSSDKSSTKTATQRHHRFSAVFGANTLAALLIQTAWTWLLTDRDGLFALRLESQFFALAAYFAGLSALCAGWAIGLKLRS